MSTGIITKGSNKNMFQHNSITKNQNAGMSIAESMGILSVSMSSEVGVHQPLQMSYLQLINSPLWSTLPVLPYHYILVCPFFQKKRKELFDRFYYEKPNTLKFHDLLNSGSKEKLLKVKHFISIILKEIKS